MANYPYSPWAKVKKQHLKSSSTQVLRIPHQDKTHCSVQSIVVNEEDHFW